MQINPFESNPKGRRSPLFSSDEENDNPSTLQNKTKMHKKLQDLNTILPGLLNSQGKNNETSEYNIQEVSTSVAPENDFPDYNIPKFLTSNKYATVKQFNKNFPDYSKEKAPNQTPLINKNPLIFHADLNKNNHFRADVAEKQKSEPSSHQKQKRAPSKPTNNTKHQRRFSDSTENDSYSEKIKSNRKYPSSYEEESLLDFYSDYSNNEPKITRLSTEYSNIQLIGEGSYGKVYRATKKLDNTEYAIKESIREFKGKNKVHSLNEAHALAAITQLAEDTYIVNYHSCWIDHGKFYLEMEYCPSSLLEKIKNKMLTEEEIIILIEQITLALKLMHNSNMVHLDIKPENILISKSGKYKLADLGQCHETNHSLENIEEGDAKYLAPEILSFEFSDLPKADIFSFGMTLYEIITNENLIGGEWKVLKEKRYEKLKNLNNISNEIKTLIRNMLDENPILRPSAEEILNVLKRIQRKDIHLSKFLEETKLDFLIREVRRRKSLP